MQTVAVISDIHANLPALKAVLHEIDDLRVDSILCCGDVVGYGPHPRECVGLLRDRDIPCVLENHDIQVSTRYESRGWFGLGKSHVVMGGTYRARIGFDLGRASAKVENGTLRLWLPMPTVLCLETCRVGRQAEDVSWWNPLEPAEMEAAYRANRAEAVY